MYEFEDWLVLWVCSKTGLSVDLVYRFSVFKRRRTKSANDAGN